MLLRLQFKFAPIWFQYTGASQNLLYRRTSDPNIIEDIPARPLQMELDDPSTEDEARETTNELQCDKSAGPMAFHMKCLKQMVRRWYRSWQLFYTCRKNGFSTQDQKDATTVRPFKGKGDKSSCDKCCGIFLLSIAGKILSKVILNRLNTHLLDEAVPESKCGFHSNRGTVNMIFPARQIQEKCKEQNRDLYMLFVDLKKAFDTVS